MSLFVLDPLDAINLAFAFEIVDARQVASVTPHVAGLIPSPVADVVEFFTGDRTETFGLGDRRLYILYINPEDYSFQQPQAATAIPAQGLVFADDVGFATGVITITGRFGAKKRIAHDRFGQKDLLSGHEQFLELEGFLQDYRKLRKEGKPVELRFHAYRYNAHYAVIPIDFTYQKNRQTRIGSPKYSLRLRTYRQLDSNEIPRSFLDVINSIISVPLDIVRGVVDTLTIGVAELRALATIPLIVTSQLNPLITSVEALVEEIELLGSTTDAIRSLSTYRIRRLRDAFAVARASAEDDLHDSPDATGRSREIYRTVAQMSDELETLAILTERASEAGSRSERWRRHVRDSSTISDAEASDIADRVYPDGTPDIDGSARIIAAAERLRRGLSNDLRISRRTFENLLIRFDRYVGWVPYRLSEGETVFSVAAGEYGDPSRWMDIVLANNLVHPYFGRGEGVAGPGDLIRLPTSGPGPSIPFVLGLEDFPEFNAELERRLFGVDLKLRELEDGLLDLTPTADLLDVEVIGGFNCFVQRLGTIILRTELGSNTLFPATGVAYRIGEPNLPEFSVLLLLSLREAILSESAVRRIRNELVLRQGDQTIVEYDVDTFAAGLVKIRRAVR